MLRTFTRFQSSSPKLIVNPLEVSNAHIIRELLTQFPIPNLLLFDGFGTLYTPKTPVPEQYHNIAKEYGIDVSETTIAERFKVAYSQLNVEYPIYGKGQLSLSDDWWKLLITQVFQLNNQETVEKLGEALIKHFTTTDAYRVYDDVIPNLTKLQNLGVQMVVSSNSDLRTIELLENLGLSKYFSNVFLSCEIGVAKPDRRFFDYIARTKYGTNRGFNYAYLEKCWHVGDSFEHDFVGAVKSGWNAVLIDRHRTSEFFVAKDKIRVAQDGCFMSPLGEQENPDMLVVANNRIIVGGMNQVGDLFED